MRVGARVRFRLCSRCCSHYQKVPLNTVFAERSGGGADEFRATEDEAAAAAGVLDDLLDSFDAVEAPPDDRASLEAAAKQALDELDFLDDL